MTSDEARALAHHLWSDPAFVVRTTAANRRAALCPARCGKISASMKALAQTPDGHGHLLRARAASKVPEARAKNSAALKALAQTPEGKARKSATAKEVNARPEVRAKHSTNGKARVQTPEGAAALARAREVGQRKRRARKALAPFLHPPLWDTSGLTVCLAPPGSPLAITTP
ncbi:hypothetical protein [Roseinatronobacter sp. NSM]|uniref:hypothetical protein n=1 Tax=Roseinatronobacter sp. NSM TaxID=3457785 RepID=UPI004037094A